jgi:hypothetical protein
MDQVRLPEEKTNYKTIKFYEYAIFKAPLFLLCCEQKLPWLNVIRKGGNGVLIRYGGPQFSVMLKITEDYDEFKIARLKSPYLVKSLPIGMKGSVCYVLMETFDMDIEEYLTSAISMQERKKITHQVTCLCADLYNETGLVYSDLTHANVLIKLDEDNKIIRMVLGDLGACSVFGGDINSTFKPPWETISPYPSTLETLKWGIAVFFLLTMTQDVVTLLELEGLLLYRTVTSARIRASKLVPEAMKDFADKITVPMSLAELSKWFEPG